MMYGLLPGGKKIRSKILIDVGKIYNVKYKSLIQIGAAKEKLNGPIGVNQFTERPVDDLILLLSKLSL